MSERVCPWWFGNLLASPLRKIFNDPDKILGPYVREGMRVLEVGSGMGFFSLPLARMVGQNGKVVCVDLQDKMLEGLKRRAKKAGLIDRIEARLCTADSLKIQGLSGSMDFAFLFAVAHEVPDKDRFFSEISASMKKGAQLLFHELKGHETEKGFGESLESAKKAGMEVSSRGEFNALLVKN